MDGNEMRTLCMGCMNELNVDGSCSHCNYNPNSPRLQPYLAAGTVLDNRYLVGRVLSYNGEGVSYIAYDRVMNEKVVVREYFPDTFCTRTNGSDNVVVNPDCLAKYKTFMSEFAEVNKVLSRMRNISNIVPAVDMFAQNNTTYAVLQYVEGVSLKKFLQSNSGRLSWEQVRKLFPPIFTTLSLIHNAGIIHRGISPENILVTTKGELKIIGFCISAIRTSSTELTPELYAGYAAPEQYSSLDWQGSWTDVYSISAVLYRILTGCVPTEAYRRIGNDDLIEPVRINPDIPVSISRIIMRGMTVKSEGRIQTVTELVTRLFEQTSYIEHEKGATQTIAIQKPKANTIPPLPTASENTEVDLQQDKTKTILTVAMLVLVVILGIVLVVIIFTNDTPQSNPTSKTSSFGITQTTTTTPPSKTEKPETTPSNVTTKDYIGTGSIMPDVIGKRYQGVKSQLSNDFTVTVVEEYDNQQFSKGFIISQSIESGCEYDPELKPALTITVSAGPSKVIVPTFTGLTEEKYKEALKSLGITNVKVVYWFSNYTEKDIVMKTEIEPGKNISIKDNQELKIYVSKGKDPNATTTTTTISTDVTTVDGEDTTAPEET